MSMELKNILIILFMIFTTFAYSQNNEWKKFENETYSIKYPSKWDVKGSKMALMTGQKADFLNKEWTLIITDSDNTERIELFFDVDSDFEGYEISKKPIIIDSINGFHYTYIKEEEYIETVLLKNKTTWFKFDNNEIRDEKFKEFYSSFKLKKN